MEAGGGPWSACGMVQARAGWRVGDGEEQCTRFEATGCCCRPSAHLSILKPSVSDSASWPPEPRRPSGSARDAARTLTTLSSDDDDACGRRQQAWDSARTGMELVQVQHSSHLQQLMPSGTAPPLPPTHWAGTGTLHQSRRRRSPPSLRCRRLQAGKQADKRGSGQEASASVTAGRDPSGHHEPAANPSTDIHPHPPRTHPHTHTPVPSTTRR